MNAKIEYWNKLSIKSSAEKGIRSRLAWLFRKVAVLIDGRQTVTICMTASHHIDRNERIDILVAGFSHAKRLYEERVKQEAIEEAMREVCADLQENDQ